MKVRGEAARENSDMMTCRRLRVWRRVYEFLWRPARRRRERETRENLRWLVEHPNEGVYFE